MSKTQKRRQFNSTKRILIADDDRDLLELLRAILLNKGYVVATALNADEAFELFQKHRPQVVVLDVNMPGITGIELAERIRTLDQQTQIIIMTAYSDVDFAVQAIQYQVFEYVIKPFKVEELVSNIDKALERHALIQLNQETLEKYLHLVQNFPDGILEFSDEGQVLFHNAAAVEIALNNATPPKNGDFSYLKPQIAKLLKNICSKRPGQIEDVLIELKQPDGEVHTVQLSVNAFTNSARGQASYLAILRDVTRRKKYEEEIIAARNRFQSIFDAITDPIILVNRDYFIESANRSTQSLTRLSNGELQKLKCNDVICRQATICHDCPVTTTFKTGKTAVKLLTLEESTGGETKHYELSTYPLRNSSMAVDEVILYAKDVTQSKKLHSQIIQSEKMASIGQLATGLAHELKNPLAIISASAQFCLSKLDLSTRAREHLEVIFRNIQNANKIVTQLLSYARPPEMVLRPLNMNWVINSALSLTSTQIENKSIRLTKQLSSRLPDIAGDCKALEQVLVNILLNAIQALPEKGKLHVRSLFDKKSRTVVVRVKDNGPGIPKENLRNIFDPFFTTRSDGTGLGLSICQRIIDNHKGTLRAESEIGKGSEFIIEIPAPGK